MEVQEARRMYDLDEHLRIFPYTYLYPENGSPLPDYDENLRAFRLGKDQASYDRLLHKLETQANRGA